MHMNRPNDIHPASCHAGLVIRRLREIMGISQSNLARQANVNLSYVCWIENHPSNLSIGKLMQICNAIGTSTTKVIRLLEQDSLCTNRRGRLQASWLQQETSWNQGRYMLCGGDTGSISSERTLRIADAPGDGHLNHTSLSGPLTS